MAEEMNDEEHKNLQILVHRIVMHIVEGSAAVQELKATVARLKHHRSNLECVVAENWLLASKIIQEAGKNITSWENFINALRITYGDDEETLKPEALKEEDNLLEKSCKDLWGQGEAGHMKSTEYHITEYNISSTNLHPQTESDIDFLRVRDSPINESSCYAVDETQPEMQVALTVGEPNDKPPSRKKKKERVNPDELDGKYGKKPRIQFSNGRELDDEHVLALKKSGRCFFCEEWGHRAFRCPENPENFEKSYDYI